MTNEPTFIPRPAQEAILAYEGGPMGVSAVPGDGSPIPFYTRLGFVPTGEVEDGEDVLRLDLTAQG